MDKYSILIEKAKEILPTIETVAEETLYEDKGILYSEFLFMACCLNGVNISRIIESGRARGQSTLLLAKTFPNIKIISIEYDQNSPDVSIANDRLKNYKNVQLLFGDSMRVIPPLLTANEVVIIDGPKGFLAVRLAIKLLATKKVTHVFIHDVSVGESCRDFLDIFFKEAIYSDYRELAKITSILDEKIIDHIPFDNRMDGFTGEYGYGFTLGCIPYSNKRIYPALYWFSFLYDLLHSDSSVWYRLKRKIQTILP